MMTYEQELKAFTEVCDMLDLPESCRISGAIDILSKYGNQSTGLKGALKEALRREAELKATKEAMIYIEDNEPLMQSCSKYFVSYRLYCAQNQVDSVEKVKFNRLIREMGYINRPKYIAEYKITERVWVKE